MKTLQPKGKCLLLWWGDSFEGPCYSGDEESMYLRYYPVPAILSMPLSLSLILSVSLSVVGKTDPMFVGDMVHC